MRETQRSALEMFIDRGFTNVTVEQVAEAVGLSPSTVYRHFGTKEHLVLWDEHAADIDSALGKRLGVQPPLDAIRDALVESLAGRSGDEGRLLFQRVSYIYATVELHAAAVEADFRSRDELTAALELVLPVERRRAAPVLAGAAMVALDVALDRWRTSEGSQPLEDLLVEAFGTIIELGTIGVWRSPAR